jgi:hypothetical protein
LTLYVCYKQTLHYKRSTQERLKRTTEGNRERYIGYKTDDTRKIKVAKI